MVDPSVEFLALTAHPQVGRWIADRHVTFVFDPAAGTIVWANGAGADMLEAADIAGLSRPTPRQRLLVTDLARLVTGRSDPLLPGGPGQIRGRIVLPVDVYQVTITCSAYPLMPPARTGLHLVTLSWTVRERDEKWPLTRFCQLIAGSGTATIADPSGMYFVSSDDMAKARIGQTIVSAPADGLKAALAALPGAQVHQVGGLDLPLVLMDRPDTARPAVAAPSGSVLPELPRSRPVRLTPPVPPGSERPEPAAAPADPPPARTAAPAASLSPPAAAAPPPAAPAPAPSADSRDAVRPLHFAWQMDADLRFTYVSDRLAEALGAPPGHPMGLGWQDLAADPGFDPDGRVGRALAEREPWSGLTVFWPSEDGTRRIPVDLSGLAIQTTAGFGGYRGFGLARLGDARAVRTPAPRPADDIPPPADPDPGLSRLTRPEEAAFRQIAEALGARYEGDTRPARPSASAPARPAPASPRAAPDPRLLLDRLPLAVIVARGEEILAVNPAALTLLGHADRAALDAAGGLAAILGGRSDAAAGGPPRKDAPVQVATGSGGTVDVRVRIAPVPWSDGMAALITLEDLRSGIRAIDLAISGDGVVPLDDRGRIATVDDRAAALLGRPAEALAGLDPADLLAAGDDARALAEAIRSGLPAEAIETVVRLPGGGTRPLRIALARLNAGPLRAAALLLSDLSAAHAHRAALEHAVQEAERLADRKAALFHHLGQELRTPLNAIIGFAEVMLEERLGPVGTPRYREFLRDIRASGAHILTVVNDLVDLARAETGRPVRTVAIAAELNPVVREAIELMQAEAQAERVLVRSSLGPGLPRMLAEPANVRRIVLNLLSNAIRYNVAGGQAIVSTAYDDNSGLVIRIRDTGVGMTREEIAAALDPARQMILVHADADGPAGSGLGLPLAKALTEAGGGSFRLVSQPGQGTLAEIVLPAERM